MKAKNTSMPAKVCTSMMGMAKGDKPSKKSGKY